MKKVLSIILFGCVCLLLSCSKQHAVNPESSGKTSDTGVLQVSVHMAKVGALQKAMKPTEIELTKLDITLSAEGQTTIFDTIELTGGIYARTERLTFPGLIAFVNGEFVEWTLSVQTRDREDQVIHSGDTTFTIIPLDTVTIPLNLSSQYSMLVANFFPIRDSVTRCELQVDGDTVADSSFTKQSHIGDTVTLSYDYLTATSTGISHHIDLNVYGDFNGVEKLFYRGDTTIIVTSGEDTNCNISLSYVGPVPVYGALTIMDVSIGRVGNATINGKLFAFDRYLLTMTKSGNGTVSGPDSVTHGIPYSITATPTYGYNFTRWEVTSGTAAIANSSAALTMITLEDGNATVKGVFEFMMTGASGYSE